MHTQTWAHRPGSIAMITLRLRLETMRTYKPVGRYYFHSAPQTGGNTETWQPAPHNQQRRPDEAALPLLRNLELGG
eukprot:12930885-Prorocentrum_lima.AAC.1